MHTAFIHSCIHIYCIYIHVNIYNIYFLFIYIYIYFLHVCVCVCVRAYHLTPLWAAERRGGMGRVHPEARARARERESAAPRARASFFFLHSFPFSSFTGAALPPAVRSSPRSNVYCRRRRRRRRRRRPPPPPPTGCWGRRPCWPWPRWPGACAPSRPSG